MILSKFSIELPFMAATTAAFLTASLLLAYFLAKVDTALAFRKRIQFFLGLS